MSQNDTQQGILGVRSFALQRLDSDSEAGSVRSGGADSPTFDRRPEERDSARRATLAALGLVVGPPPPLQAAQPPPTGSPAVTPGALSPVRSRSPFSRSPLDPPPGYPAVQDPRRPGSPVQPPWAGNFADSRQVAGSSSPSAREVVSVNNKVDSENSSSRPFQKVRCGSGKGYTPLLFLCWRHSRGY
jgi:hypothetical protein